MYAYTEYLMIGACPYCNREFSLITTNIISSMIYQCVDCQRGITILPRGDMTALIEAGTPKFKTMAINKLSKGCCGD